MPDLSTTSPPFLTAFNLARFGLSPFVRPNDARRAHDPRHTTLTHEDHHVKILRNFQAGILFLLVAHNAASAADLAETTALLESNDPRATAAVTALVQADPKNPDVQALQVHLLLLQGDAEAAIDVAKRTVKGAPNNAPAHLWLGNAYGLRLSQVGMFSQIAIAPRLRRAYEEAVKLDPDLLEARYRLVEFYVQAPKVMGGGIDKAKSQVDEIAGRDPAMGHAARGKVLLAEKQVDSALAEFAAARAAKPDVARYRLEIGLALQRSKRWQDAFDAFQAWTRDDPDSPSAWYQLGRTVALSGLNADAGVAAIEHYLSMPLKLDSPGVQHAWFRLGQIHALAGRKDEARTAFGKALAIDPKHREAKAALAKL